MEAETLPPTGGAAAPDTLEVAVSVLAVEGDGKGFNHLDAKLGRALADAPAAFWTTGQRRAAHRMLRKYRRRLADAGIDYDAIPVPSATAERGPDWAGATRDGRFVAATEEYDGAFRLAMQGIDGARWNRDAGCWVVPGRPSSLEPLFDAIVDFDLDYSAGLVVRAEQLLEAYERERRFRQERVEASRSEDADLVVEGLGGELRPFQSAGVAYLLRQRRAFLADEMGLGKTAQALATVQAAKAYPMLVVCPAHLKLTWRREAQKWLPGRTVKAISGSKEADYDADIVIVNYDVLGKHLDGLKARRFRSLALDESHYIKNHRALRTEHCLEVGKGIELRICISGTPILNRPSELIPQLRLLGRLKDMGGLWRFSKRYCNPQGSGFVRSAYRDGASNLEELHERLRACCYVRRLKKDVLGELPAKQRAIVPVELGNRAEYRRASSSLLAFVAERAARDRERLAGAISRYVERYGEQPDEAAMEMLRAGVSRDATARAERAEALVRIGQLRRVAARGKLDATVEWVRNLTAGDEKVVVFAHHREIVRELAERLGAPTISGEDDHEDRQAAVDRFQDDPECRVVVCSISAGGLGITLTAASNAAFVEMGWNPAVHDQAEDRLHRMGQTDSVTAWYLVADGTIDEDIHELVEKKRAVVDAATDGGGGAEEDGAGVQTELIARLTKRADEGRDGGPAEGGGVRDLAR